TGWRLRDCSGRGATRLNGKVVIEAALADGDLLQLGSFSFQVVLPEVATATPAVAATPATAAAPVVAGRHEHLERSRRKLARHALRLRRRVQEQARALGEQAQLQAALQQQVEAFQQRLGSLEQAERDLAAEREALDADYADLEERIERGEQEL